MTVHHLDTITRPATPEELEARADEIARLKRGADATRAEALAAAEAETGTRFHAIRDWIAHEEQLDVWVIETTHVVEDVDGAPHSVTTIGRLMIGTKPTRRRNTK